MADRLKCPTCGNYMSVYNVGTSSGHKNQAYDKTEYQCGARKSDGVCGTWVTVEVPKDNN